MEAITEQTGSSSFVPYGIIPVSDSYPRFKEKKPRKGAPFAQQDKGLARFASVPPSEYLGQWETHMAEKNERRKLTRAQKDVLGCVSWALKDAVLSKMETDAMFRYRVQSRVFIERHWKLLSKDYQERNPFVPEILHDGYIYVKNVTDEMLALFGMQMTDRMKETVVKELFWLFLVGGHVYVNGSTASNA